MEYNTPPPHVTELRLRWQQMLQQKERDIKDDFVQFSNRFFKFTTVEVSDV